MPLYEYYCPVCDRTIDVVLRISELEETKACRMCSAPMRRLMSAPHIQMDYPGYQCPVSGKWVEGRAAHKANLHQHGCRVLEPGEKEAAERRRNDADKQLEAKLEATMAKETEALPREKKQRLYQEMERGASATVVRQ